MYQAQSSHLPLKVNMAGVIPAIFASSILLFPASIAQWFGSSGGADWLQDLAVAIGPGQPLNILLFTVFVVFFCFFYTALMFNPVEVADNLKRSGAFVPGIRPGTTDRQLYRWRADSADGIRICLYCAGLLDATVPGGDVERALLSGWYLTADRGCCGNGFYGPGAEPPYVAPVRFGDEEGQLEELWWCWARSLSAH